MEVLEDSGGAQRDIKELFNCKSGIESAKSTERRKYTVRLRELLELPHVVDYLISCSNEESQRGRSRSSNGVSGAISWAGLWRSVLVYVKKETEAISKLEEKGTGTTSAFTSRQTKKKDVAETVRTFCKAGNRKGHHLPAGEMIDHFLSVLGNSQLGVWLGKDYSQILLQHIITHPHYVLHMSAHTWEELTSAYCAIFLSPPSSSFDRALLSKVIHTLVTQWLSQSDLPIPKLYTFFVQAFANIGDNSKVWEHLLAALVSFSSVAVNARGRLCSLGEDIFLTCLHQWSRCAPAVKDLLTEFFRIQLIVHHPRGSHTDEEGAWAANDTKWQSHLEKLYDQLITDLETTTSNCRLSWGRESSIKFELLDLMVDVFNQVFWIRSQTTFDPSHHRAKRRKATSGWSVIRDGLHSTSDSTAAAIWLKLVAWFVFKWPKSLHPPDHASLLSSLAQMLRESKRATCVRWVLVCLQALALHPSASSSSIPLTLSPSSTTILSSSSSIPSLQPSSSLLSPTSGCGGGSEHLWQKIWNSTIKMLCVRTAEEEGYNLLTVLLEMGVVNIDHDPWKLLLTALQQPGSCMVRFLAALLACHPLPETLHFDLPLPMTLPGLTQTTQSSSSPPCSSLYPLRSQLLNLLLPTNSALMESQETMKFVHLSNMSTSTPVSLLAAILIALTQRSCGSAQVPSLKSFYLCSNSRDYLQGILRASSAPPVSLAASKRKEGEEGEEWSREDVWGDIERVYLQSTFDLPLNTSCPHTTTKSELTLSRETTITELQTLLLKLLSERGQLLLQQPTFEPSVTSRERVQALASLVVGVAQHTALIVHSLLLLCHCEAFPSVEQLRRTLAVRALPSLLKRFVSLLRDPLWNDVESAFYYQSATAGLEMLSQLLCFPHVEGGGFTLSSSVAKALRVVKKLCCLSMPNELIELVTSLAQGKWPIVTPSASGTFSLCGTSSTSTSRGPSLTRDSQSSSNFDDDMDIGESNMSTQADPSATNLATPADVLSNSSLNDKSVCQIKAAKFLSHTYLCLSTCSHGDGDVPDTGGEGGVASNVQGTLLLLLEDLSGALHVQLIFGILQTFADSAHPLDSGILKSLVSSLGPLLRLHRNNQTVYSCGLKMLTQLVSHLSKAPLEVGNDSVKRSSRSLLSAFWTLYKDQRLCSAVRIELARLIQVMLEADRGGKWAWIEATRKRRSPKEGGAGDKTTSLKDAMISLLNDADHRVRMHMATAVTSLFFCGGCEESHDSQVTLIPRKDQESIYDKILAMLQDANQVMADQDQLSVEDDSVNRVASMITTLLHVACVSPVSERNVAALLINAVGQIDHDLVAKALSLLAAYLGYSSRRQFLDDMLVSLVRKWVEQHHPLTEFPTKLLEFETPKEFFSAYSCQVVPLLVAKCDEATLNTLAKDVLATPLPDLLRESLPACMVLILSTYSEQRWEAGEGGEPVAVSEEEKKTALNSHNLLTQILSEEVISQTIQNSIDEFVVELLVRMFELPTADSHLARFCLNSDPEPCRPHYSSHAVRATLDYLPSCYGNSAMGNSFIRLLSRKKDNIQKILLSLAVKIDSTHRCFLKRRLLLSYNLFVKLVCRELHDGLDKTQSFVVMDTIHTVSRVLSGITATSSNLIGQLFPLCCDVLETLCRAVVTACPHELENHLQTVVACLVPFAGENSPHGKQSLSLLTYLLQAADPDYVTQLDPFPESVPLPSELRQQMGGATNLLSEIDRFLSVGVYSSRTEGLRALGTLLHKSRFEISSLIEKGCHGDSAILRLVQGLLSLCRGPECTRGMRSEVARCLGEVGPVDFRCIALSSHNHHIDTFDVSSLPSNWSPPHVYTAKLLYQLTMMLMDKSITVVQASSECLRAVLATKTGAFVLTKLEEISSETSEWFLYLEPFKPQRRKRATSASTVAPPTATPTIIDACDLWVPSGGVSHCQWLTRLVTTIIDSDAVEDEVLKATRNVCSVKVEFCEEVFPLLVYDLLCSRSGEWRRIISLQLRLFFATVDSTSSRPSTPSIANHTPSITPITPDSIRTILNMIMYLRTVDRPTNSRGSGTQWDNNFWLDLDFLAVAKAAHVCSAHFTSLLFTEIWHGAKGQQSINNDVMEIEPGEQSRVLESSDIQRMLLQAYSQIGEPDSLYGACSAHAADEMTRVHLYEHEKEWSKSLSACDLQMLLPGATSESTLAESLRQLGLYHVLNMYLCGVKSVKGEGVRDVSEYQYEAAWRCAQWEEGAIMTSSSSGLGGYHQTLYGCLTSLKDGEADLVNTFVTDARGHVMSSLLSTGLESTYALYPLLSQLLCLLEVEEAGSILTSSCPTERISSLVKDWKDRLPLLNSDFQFVEPVLAARCSLLYCLLQNAAAEVKGQVTPPVELRRKVDHLFEALSDSLQTRVEFAREAGSYQVCEGALFALSRHVSQLGCYGVAESLHPSLPWTLKLEEAKLNWERKDTTLAMALLKSLLSKLTKLIDPAPSVKALYPPALCLYGSWLAETRSENPSVIMKNYLEKSVELMEDLHSNNDLTAVVGAYLTLARYADSQYQRINRQMKSSSFEAKKQLLSKTKKDIKRLEDELSVDARNRNRHYRTLVAQSGEDEIAMTSLLTDKDSFLCKALENYMLCLRAGDKYDLRVFRLCSLWFANSTHQEVNKLIEKGSNLLESRKFLPLMYQLAARMSARQTRSQFQTILQKIIFRTTVDHPHHCLYVILALSNASKDNVYPMSGHVTGTRNTGRSGKLSKKQSFSGSVDEDKVKAAGDMIRKLRSEKLTLVQSVEKLCEAFIDLAYHDVTAFKKERGPVKLPSTCLLLKLHKLEMVAVPTVEIPVDPTCRYDNIISIDGFDSFFQLAGGVNLPKVMSCLGSDGKRRRQLVKGRDDLRQDAVMQQVFVLVNRLLQKDPSTMKRRLCVRTYKVIPLSQRSGIVEWCEGTLPLGEYLIGSPQNPYTGAHCRYQPNDWLSFDCRKRLTTAKTQKAKMYGEICRHFKPVFHHFFMEKFTSPPQWFERRLTYTRSVAASSIVGYIVGLGDRHVQNILIDTNSAELIHIDLGVAFEQGKTLPTPETVPFRLTRDLVDGMGLTGVEGVFRQCCEKTMFLMRTYHEELRTILEVLLYDPLYQWTLSPLKAMHLQRRQEPAEESTTFFDGDNGTSSTAPSNGQEDSTNKMAERVLLRLQEKLEGIEDGVPLSIHGQVNHLIQEATDPANLCLLFPGWQPWI